MTPGTGTTLLGRYRILDRLGEGGMGVVFAADDLQLERRVAIKTIASLGAPARDGTARERLLREARAGASVNHPNICQVYEVAEHDQGLFIAMELLEGEPLSARLARAAMPLAEAIASMLQVLSALEALHRRGLAHRDLKPSNVFLTPHGAKLLDFGLARHLAATDDTIPALTLPGTLLGSPGYMAPEQIQGGLVDARADLFAAGVMLYEMLAGRPPFPAATVVQALHAALYEQPPALSGSPVIVAADRVIRRALAKRPEDRYQDAAAMAADLRAVLATVDSGEVPQAHPTTRLIVLPFRILRPDADTDFLAFSLADAIGTTLSSLGSLIVRSSMAASRFSADQPDLRALARDAEVDVAVTGTLLRAGNQLRVAAQLVAVPEGTILWSEHSQVPLGDVFQLQDDLARRIVESLALPLTAREHRLLGRDVPASARAYELFLRANQHFYDAERWPVARDLYTACVAEDPRFAPAWARLGRCHRLAAKFTAASSEQLERELGLAQAAFTRALEINPDLPSAHHLYTALETDLGRSLDAIERLLQQVRIRPADPELYAGLVHACRYTGLLDPSVAAHERARQLDPQVPSSVVHTYWMQGAYELSLDERVGGQTLGYVRGLSLAMLGREAEAIEHLREREATLGATMGAAYMRALRMLLEGDLAASRAAAEQAIARNPDPESVFYQARTLARAGAYERALDALEAVVRGGYYCHATLVRDPWLDPLRGDARFTALVHRAADGRREAAARYIAAGGDRLLGVQP